MMKLYMALMINAAFVAGCASQDESQATQESTGGFCINGGALLNCYPNRDQLFCQDSCQQLGYITGYCPEYSQTYLNYCLTHCDDAKCGSGTCYPSLPQHCASGDPP